MTNILGLIARPEILRSRRHLSTLVVAVAWLVPLLYFLVADNPLMLLHRSLTVADLSRIAYMPGVLEAIFFQLLILEAAGIIALTGLWAGQSIIEERRRRSLPLLLQTPASSLTVFMGKGLGAAATWLALHSCLYAILIAFSPFASISPSTLVALFCGVWLIAVSFVPAVILTTFRGSPRLDHAVIYIGARIVAMFPLMV